MRRTRLLKIGNEVIEVPVELLQSNDILKEMVVAVPETQVINIFNCDPMAFKILLNYLATGTVRYITPNLLILAHKLQEYRLKKMCEDYFCSQINLQNAFFFIEIGHSSECNTLITKTARYVVNNQTLGGEFHQAIIEFINRNRAAAMLIIIAYYRTITANTRPNCCHFFEMDEWMKEPYTEKRNEIIIDGNPWEAILYRFFEKKRYNLSLKLTPLFANNLTVNIKVTLERSHHPHIPNPNNLTVEKKNCIFDDKVRSVTVNIMKFSDFKRRCNMYVYLDDLLVDVFVKSLEREE